MHLPSHTFLVTGGASGLGEGTARHLVTLGARVVIADVQDDRGHALARELGATYVHCDVTDETQAQAAVDAAVALGELRGLVGCAGIAPAAKVVGKSGPHPLDVFERTLRVNLLGTFNVLRLAAQAMAANAPLPTGERGVLVNTASVAATDGQIGQAAYAASKAGVAGMTLPIARDLAPLGIRCVTIAPGLFATPMLAGMPQHVQDALGAMVPFPSRLGTPHDFARLVQHVLENEMLNGEVIRLDGAVRLAPR